MRHPRAAWASAGLIVTSCTGASLREALGGAVANYRKIVVDPQMFLPYKVIISERLISSEALFIGVLGAFGGANLRERRERLGVGSVRMNNIKEAEQLPERAVAQFFV